MLYKCVKDFRDAKQLQLSRRNKGLRFLDMLRFKSLALNPLMYRLSRFQVWLRI
jgi:hypothetical protein